ncbi:vitrin isoform X4 [Astatotilapia calliptera]|uniref:vitrin isoform X4 n=1 Tax=Astatotilapia calliptera TaxID=8154 RepID=UPI000E3FFB43|nr:vitrin isoform X4 [Astatotilapia calliptera]XP_042082280.1 vitrin isoform X6 [Haplochromis burtoni]
MIRASLTAICLALLLSYQCWAKPNGPKNKKPKQVIPAVECDVRAGKVNLPEFIVKCPPRCRETRQQVYGTGVFASISSICNAAIHSGVITNSGGKVIVRKMAGQNVYKGSNSNGVRSLSLPKWRESFVVSVGKPKKGVIYPSTLDYVPSRPTYVKTNQKETTMLPPTSTAPEPTTTTPEPTTTTTTTPTPTTASTTTPPPPTTKARPVVHKVREAGSIHPYLAHAAASNSRQSQSGQRKSPSQVFRGGSYSHRVPQRASAGIHKQEPGSPVRRQPSSPVGAVQRPADSDRKIMDTANTKVEPVDAWNPEAPPYELGFSVREQEPLRKAPEPVSQGNPDCKVDLAFLMDGSWSIGKRRFKIQKDFLTEVAQTINAGVAGPMMGIIQYGDDPVTEISLKTHSSSRELKAAIDKIVQKGGLSNVGKALHYINKHYFSDANGNRGGAPNVAVILVDGWPTDKVEEASRLARESGINIFFVTIEGPDDNEKQNLVEANFVDKAVCRTNGFFSLPVNSWFALRKAVQPLVKRVCDTDRLVCSKTCLNANDIAFVIDGSSSVGTGNFRTVLQFVANITREFEISDTDTRVGAVQYTYEQRLEFAFGQYNNKAELLNAIKRINYWSGGTSTGAAITYAAEQLFSKSKPNKRKIMIVITDGRSYDDVRAPALAVHRQGVIAYSIGIAWAAQDELEYIATDPDKEHSFFVDEFDNLYKFVPKIIHNICQEFNSQPRN